MEKLALLAKRGDYTRNCLDSSIYCKSKCGKIPKIRTAGMYCEGYLK